MGAEAQRNLFGVAELEGLERAAVEGEVQLLYRGVPLYAFGTDDPVGRDFVIASLLRSGLRGKTVAKLCGAQGTSPECVSGRPRVGSRPWRLGDGRAARPS